MIAGRFGEDGELLFEIELIANNGERFPVEALLDTGFTTGFLAINFQELEALGWALITPQIEMETARGNEFFDIYEGRVILDGQEFIIPVHVGDELFDILIGSQWLEMMELAVNKPRGILTLKMVASE
ncbi:aspartyl protease [Aerosakkonema sp. BLCC-F183]|uniref:aspartyl protease n=1 Tax=Aerosakkonema sp. BLCC-F183 TaxID=3342834 RepID=UPI0035B82EAD